MAGPRKPKTGPTPARGARVTQEMYEALVQAYREQPGIHARAAKAAKTTPSTATKGWHKGWPKRGWPPIKDLMKAEQLEARAQASEARRLGALAYEQQQRDDFQARLEDLSRQANDMKLKAREDAIRTRKEEGEMVQMSRGAIRLNLGALIKLSQEVLNKVVPQLVAQIESGYVIGATGRKRKLTTHDQLKLMNQLALLLSRIIPESERAIKMERLLLGEPTEIIGLNLHDMDAEEVIEMHEATQWAVERAKKRRGLEVIDGGASAPPTGVVDAGE